MAKTRGPGLSGIAIAMVGTGVLAVYAAIKGTSPLEEIRALLTGKRPEPLSKESRGTPLSATGAPAPTNGGKARTVGAKPHVAVEAEFIANTWGIVADATLVTSGHITNSDHYTGHAIDAMVGGGQRGYNIGTAIFNHYIQNAAAKHVKYIIWQHTIWSPSRGSRRYSLSDHMKHVHISFNPLVIGAGGRR
jgi:hypothetical protein